MTEVNPEIENLGQIEAGGGGLAKQTSRLLGLDSGTNLMGRDASIGDLRDAALKAGGGDLDQGLKNIAALTQGRGNPDAAYSWMKKAIETPDVVGVEDDADTTGFDLARWSMVSASAFSDFILSFANGVVSVSAGFLGNRRALD